MHVINRSPTTAVAATTPEEAWSNIKPSVDHFRVFGCVAHVHIPDNQRKKLDDKSFKCVWLGVSGESKAYRLYDPAGKKIITSRDVICVENEAWNWNRNAEEMKNDVLEWEDNNEGINSSKGAADEHSNNDDEEPENDEEPANSINNGEELAPEETCNVHFS